MILDSEEKIKEYTDKGWWGTDTILDLFIRNAKNSPDAVAVVDPPNRSAWTTGYPWRDCGGPAPNRRRPWDTDRNCTSTTRGWKPN